VERNNFARGIELLRQPVLPLVSMVQFFFMTGQFETTAAVIEELPEPIETDYAIYKKPKALLSQYSQHLDLFEDLKKNKLDLNIVNEQGIAVDRVTGGSSWIRQAILTSELEKINSELCAPCDCTLCCIGPDHSMAQDFFEIPLSEKETYLFPVQRHDNEATRNHRAMDKKPMKQDKKEFFAIDDCALFHWKNGWSLILPRGSLCPNLISGTGRCNVYRDRPLVCRRPQIFPYIIEPLDNDHGSEDLFRIRDSILAVTDCPYVRILKEEIGGYAAASELKLVFSQNKK